MHILLWHIWRALSLCLLSSGLLWSQGTESEDFLTDQYQNVDLSAENAPDVTTIIDLDIDRTDQFLDVNVASVEDFLKLQIISLHQIEELIKHRNSYGLFMTLEELQCLPSWDIHLIKELKPFLYVGENHDQLHNWRARLKDPGMVWTLKSGAKFPSFTPGVNSGNLAGTVSPYQWTFRYKLEYNDFVKIGFTAEQDGGERFFGHKSKFGFDFYAAYIHLLKPLKWCRELILGDFTIGLGQGLIRHHDYGGNKSSQVMSVKKSVRRIKPFNSIQENKSMRGLALSIPLQKKLTWLGYISYRRKDASVVYDSTLQFPQRFTALQLSGSHRTQKEVEYKDAVDEFVGGFNAEYKQKSWMGSVNYQLTHFNVPWIKEPALYRSYQFKGDHLQQFSLDYTGRYRNITAFGELALSQWKGKAMMQGILMTLDKFTDLSTVFRYYSKNYHAFDASAFGDAAIPSNEYGLYIGLCIRPVKNIEINAFADHWVNTWLTYRRNGSSYSRDYMVRINFQKRKHYNAYIQYRYVSKPLNGYEETGANTSAPLPYTLHKIRGHINVLLDKSFEFRSRIEWSSYQHISKNATGILLYQDILYHPLYAPWNFVLRMSIYDVGDFDSRIYAYENSVSQESSIPFYQGRGARFYLVLKNKIGKHIKLEMKYSKDYMLKNHTYFGEFNRPQGYGIGELIAQVLVNI
jgi:hypothetical protein